MNSLNMNWLYERTEKLGRYCSRLIPFFALHHKIIYEYNIRYCLSKPFTTHFQGITTYKEEISRMAKFKPFLYRVILAYVLYDLSIKNYSANCANRTRMNLDTVTRHIWGSVLLPFYTYHLYSMVFTRFFIHKNYKNGRNAYYGSVFLLALLAWRYLDNLADFLHVNTSGRLIGLLYDSETMKVEEKVVVEEKVPSFVDVVIPRAWRDFCVEFDFSKDGVFVYSCGRKDLAVDLNKIKF